MYDMCGPCIMLFKLWNNKIILNVTFASIVILLFHNLNNIMQCPRISYMYEILLVLWYYGILNLIPVQGIDISSFVSKLQINIS